MKSQLILYADDSIIICSNKYVETVKSTLGFELDSCNRWLIENKLSIHMGKYECVLYGSNVRKVSNLSVSCNNCTINATSSIQYVGSILEQDLSVNIIASMIKYCV